MIVQSTPDRAEQLAKQRAPYAIVPDQQTESEMTSGKPPSYRVVVQGNDGRMSVLTAPSGNAYRWVADPAKAQAKAATDFAAQRQQANFINSIPAGTGSL
jgi:hypothetical protein